MEALGLVAVVALACWVTSAALRWLIEDVVPRSLRPVSGWWERRRAGRAVTRPVDAVLLELELRRVAERLQQEYASAQPAKAERVRGWFIAYDRVLIELCESSSVPSPRRGLPLSADERFALEHALVGAGRSW